MSRLSFLTQQYASNSITSEELEEFFALMNMLPDTTVTNELMLTDENSIIEPVVRTKEEWQNNWTSIHTSLIAAQTAVRPVRVIKTKWFRYTAAIFVFAIGLGVYYLNNQSRKSYKSGESVVRIRGDVAPGTNRAILTINDKQNIDLATDKTGININNSITYNDGEKIADAGQLLQLTTPRGGQYQAVLPDGSKVWLNAASSIKFPSAFAAKERRVEITGEVYFEIVKDASMPFNVYSNEQKIEVLGTSFNVNHYKADPNAKTTLIEGAIKINNKILQPGQAYMNGKIIQTDIEQDLAWKNGLFNFNGESVEEVMNQLARWYDLEIVYKQGIPSIELGGKMHRSLPLSEMLRSLEGLGVHCKLEEGRQLIVYP